VQILLHEGGPTLFGQFLAAEAVDELFLTLSPQIAGRAAHTNRPGIVQGVEFAPNNAPWYQPGLQVKIDHPGGSFVLHRKSEKTAVFLAGGIGITPFVSIIRQAGHDIRRTTCTCSTPIKRKTLASGIFSGVHVNHLSQNIRTHFTLVADFFGVPGDRVIAGIVAIPPVTGSS